MKRDTISLLYMYQKVFSTVAREDQMVVRWGSLGVANRLGSNSNQGGEDGLEFLRK